MEKIHLNELILIGSDVNNPRMQKYIKKIQRKENYLHSVVSLDKTSTNTLFKYKIPHERGESYLKEDFEQIECDTSCWLSDWIIKERKNGLSIFENFKHQNDSFWWLIDRRIRFEIHEIHMLIRILQALSHTFETNKITLYDETNRLEVLVPQIFKKGKIRIQNIPHSLLNKIKSRFLKNLKIKLGILLINLRERWYEFLSRNILAKYSSSVPIPESCIVTLTNLTSWRLCYNPNSNQFEVGDFYFSSINNKLPKQSLKKSIELYKIQNFRKDLKVLKDKYSKNFHTPLIILDSCMTTEARRQLGNEKTFFKERYRIFQQELLSDEDFVISNVNFSLIIKERLQWFFNAYIPLGLRWKALFNGFIAKNNPSIILFINEFFTFGRSLVLSSREYKNTLAIAIQHGFFTGLDLGITELGINNKVNRCPQIPPLYPDITAVYGPYYENLLLKAGYPKEAILISGNPNYDFLKQLVDRYTKKEILRDMDLISDKKIIVFATQPDFFETALTPLNTIIELGSKYQKFQLIIKVHPREDVTKYNQFQKNAEIPILVIRDMNIFLVILACDLFLTQHSTTIIDALILGKAVGTINIYNKPLSLKFLESKAIIKFKTTSDIFKLIPRILEDENFQSELEKHQMEFLFDQIYKNDGKAAERIITIINKKIEEYNK